MNGIAGSEILVVLTGLLGILGGILLLTWSVRRVRNESRTTRDGVPLAILQRRYARGEIGSEEYERVRSDLLRDGGGRVSADRRDRAVLLGGLAMLGIGLLGVMPPWPSNVFCTLLGVAPLRSNGPSS